MLRLRHLVGLATAALLSATPAAAQPVYFNVTGPFTASWSLDVNPVPSFVGNDPVDGYFFQMTNVAVDYNGMPMVVDLEFFPDEGGGGVCAGFQCELFNLLGPALFTLNPDTPTFQTNTYTMTQDVPNSPTNGQTATLVISRTAPVPVPEPSSLLLLGAGGAALLVVRRRLGA